jgi:hypothetical protein
MNINHSSESQSPQKKIRVNAKAPTTTTKLFEMSSQDLQKYSENTRRLVQEVRVFHFAYVNDHILKANKRGINLLLLPPGMSRRNQNESYVNETSSSIFWKMTVTFVLNGDFSPQDIVNSDPGKPYQDGFKVYSCNMLGIDENTTVKDFLDEAISVVRVSL